MPFVLRPEDEARFDTVTYTYFEQLNGYEHLKSLGIGYHFFEGRYTSAIGAVLDATKKTIIHIPYVGQSAVKATNMTRSGRSLMSLAHTTGWMPPPDTVW